MKAYDLSVSTTFPKIPDIIFIMENRGEMHIFKSSKELFDFCFESFYDEIKKSWLEMATASFSADLEDWFYDFSFDDLDQFLYSLNWDLHRKALK